MTEEKRGQASAPMELMIGVIILVMSMALVFYVMGQTQDSQCIAQVKANVRNLESAMLAVALGSPPTTKEVFFDFKSCGEKAVKTIRLARYEDPKYCRACPGQQSGCWIIEPVFNTGKDNKYYVLADAQSCIDMPANVQIAVDSVCMNAINKYMASNENPCGLPVSAECTADKTLISSSVWNKGCTQAAAAGGTLPSSCKALFSSFTSKGGNFKFKLKKSIVSTGGKALGQIEVCPTRA
ncbi:hypothetical protein HY993_04885 [Candidatus Micrarchaeota archaeon]|nr:hypothetical protein [Candidatus Micrarchaeota archaeon]